jgi:hypothetical protein
MKFIILVEPCILVTVWHVLSSLKFLIFLKYSLKKNYILMKKKNKNQYFFILF